MLCGFLLTSACDRVETGGRELELDGETIRLAPGATVHDVHIAVDAGGARLRPDTIHASRGDVVRFVADDNRGYAIVFREDRLAQPVESFLERTGQLRGPPLIERGARWVVDLDAAPPGRYPFRCLTHGRDGLLLVDVE